jgi:hypothetical protein
MIVMQKNPHIDRLIDFVAKFASSLSHNPSQQTNGMDTSISSSNNNKKTKNNNAENEEANMSTNQTQATIVSANQSLSATMTNTLEEEEFENVFLTALIDYLILVRFFLN